MMRRGGGSSGIRSTCGTWNRFSLIYILIRFAESYGAQLWVLTSADRAAVFAKRPVFANVKALGFLSGKVNLRAL